MQTVTKQIKLISFSTTSSLRLYPMCFD